MARNALFLIIRKHRWWHRIFATKFVRSNRGFYLGKVYWDKDALIDFSLDFRT